MYEYLVCVPNRIMECVKPWYVCSYKYVRTWFRGCLVRVEDCLYHTHKYVQRSVSNEFVVYKEAGVEKETLLRQD